MVTGAPVTLEPCPLCGGKVDYSTANGEVTAIFCRGCGLLLTGNVLPNRTLVETWNTRRDFDRVAKEFRDVLRHHSEVEDALELTFRQREELTEKNRTLTEALAHALDDRLN